MLWAVDGNRRAGRNRFEYVKCNSCGLVFLAQPPSDLEAYYPRTYYTIPSSESDLAVLSSSEIDKVVLLETFVREGSILEIGAGYGAFAYAAKRAGYHVEAIEMDQECCRFIESAAGIRALCSNRPEEVLGTLGSYDAVVMWQVVEHLRFPWLVLKGAAAHLRPNGILVVSTPNPRSLQFRAFGSRWAHLDAPRHLFLIDPGILVRRAEDIGLATERVIGWDRGSTRHDRYGWRQSSLNSLPAWLQSARAALWCARLFGRVCFELAKPLERFDLMGATYTSVFRKRA